MVDVSDTFTERFDQYWNDRPVTSLRRVQALYGAIEEARSDTTSVVPEEFELYVTPGELNGFTSDEGGDDTPKLVTVFVDLTDDEPVIETVSARTSRPEGVGKLGFSRYPWGRGIDHSITRRGAKGGSSVSTATTYCVDCLERWTDADNREPAVGRIADEHPDGWVIQQLQELGRREDLEETIHDLLEPEYSGGTRVTATVAIRLDGDRLEHDPTGDPDENGYYYPGQLNVLNAGMRARKEEKLARKNLSSSDPSSRGEAACLVTGAEDDVFGTAEDPLAFFTVQHTEKFPELKKPEAWRSHSVSSEAALLIQSGSSLVERFRTTRRGRSVYTIPYFSGMDAKRAQYLEHILDENTLETQADIAELQAGMERHAPEDASDLRFYVVVVRNDSGDINVLSESPDLSIQPARELAETHLAVLDGSTFGLSAGFAKPDGWDPIHPNVEQEDAVKSIVGGMYAYGTLSVPGDDAPTTDDPADWLTFALLSDDSVPADRLLDEYVERLISEQRDDDENRLPENHLKTQIAQLEALARAGKLEPSADPTSDDTTLTMMPTIESDPELPVRALTEDGELLARWRFREYRLNRFIDERPAFDDADRRGAFLAGVLVGQLGQHQSNTRGMNQTVLQQYPSEQMTGARIDRFLPSLVDKMNVYAADSEYSGPSLFPELEDRLADLSGLDWQLDTSDLRFHYAVGQLYGKRADYRAYELRQAVANDAGIGLENDD